MLLTGLVCCGGWGGGRVAVAFPLGSKAGVIIETGHVFPACLDKRLLTKIDLAAK